MAEVFWSESDDGSVVDEEQLRAAVATAAAEPPAKRTRASDESGVVVHRLSSTDKAGLTGNDGRIAAVVAANGAGAFGQMEQKRAVRVQHKVVKLQRLIGGVERDRQRGDVLAAARAQSVARELARSVGELERMRDLSRHVLVVDMDAFYVACELSRRPELRGLPVAVGGTSMLSTSSYEARKFGVRSAMPGFLAKQLCPELIIVPCDFELYTRVAGVVRGVFAQYDPHFSSGSLDEASLDVTDYCAAHALDVETVALQMKRAIAEQTSCTASVGIAVNRPLAKIASNVNKPDGLFRVPADVESIIRFCRALPIRKVSGVGPVSEAVLSGIGIRTVQDVWDHRELLTAITSKRDNLL